MGMRKFEGRKAVETAWIMSDRHPLFVVLRLRPRLGAVGFHLLRRRCGRERVDAAATSLDWFTAGNWTNPAAVPTVSDNADINSSNNAVINNGANAVANNVTVGVANQGWLYVINGATLVNYTGYIGLQAGSSGHVGVQGGSASWTKLLALCRSRRRRRIVRWSRRQGQ